MFMLIVVLEFVLLFIFVLLGELTLELILVLFIGLDDVVVFEVYGIGLLVVFDDVV
jgi:hypothetical protein